MSNANRRNPLAGTRPPFFPSPDEPADPVRRVRDLREILAQPRPTRARRTRPRLLTVSVAAGALAVTVVAAGLLTNQPASPPDDASTGPARHVLLAAADAAATTDAPTSGRYWHVRTQHGGPMTVAARDGNGPFTMVTEANTESWSSRTGRDQSVSVANIDFSTRPLTPADKPEWEKAGYPTPVAGPLASTQDGDPVFYFAGAPASMSEVLALPTDPAALKAWLLDRFRANPPASPAPTDQTDWLAQEAARLLANLPASPLTRAAAYQLLADLPGFRMLDAEGLPDGSGVGVARHVRLDMGDGTVRNGVLDQQVIIDPNTGLLLAEQYVLVEPGTEATPLPVGTVIYRETIVAAGWVDSEPFIPADAIVNGG